MKKIWIIGLLALLGNAMTQAGEIMVKDFVVEDFTKLRVYNNFDVLYRQSTDSAGMVVIMADKEDMEKITCTNKKERLIIKCKGIVDQENMLGSIILYSSSLEEVENNGIGSIEVASPLSGMELKAKVIGNGGITIPQVDYDRVRVTVVAGKGKVNVGGTCREAILKVTGAGQIEADDLVAEDVSCRISVNGVVGCHATQDLKIWVTGRGEVYYRGTPTIKKSSLGDLEVRSLEGME